MADFEMRGTAGQGAVWSRFLQAFREGRGGSGLVSSGYISRVGCMDSVL